MKDPVISRIDELKGFAIKLNLFVTLFNALIVFLVFAILFRVFGISAILGIFPAMIYALLHFIFSLQKVNVVKSVVTGYPSLDERLQTAYDNRNSSNIIVDSLIKEVARRMDDVRYSSFLSMQQLTSRMIVAVLLIFMFITINYINIEALGLDLNKYINKDLLNQIEDLTGMKISQGDGFDSNDDDKFGAKEKINEDKIGGSSGGKLPGVNEGPIAGFGGGSGEEGDENIFGDPSSVNVDGKNIGMDLHPDYGGDIQIKNVQDKKPAEDSSGNTIQGKSAEAAEQDPVEYRELIKKYFQSLQNIEQEQ
jgi:hypothetical protein